MNELRIFVFVCRSVWPCVATCWGCTLPLWPWVLEEAGEKRMLMIKVICFGDPWRVQPNSKNEGLWYNHMIGHIVPANNKFHLSVFCQHLILHWGLQEYYILSQLSGGEVGVQSGPVTSWSPHRDKQQFALTLTPTDRKNRGDYGRKQMTY